MDLTLNLIIEAVLAVGIAAAIIGAVVVRFTSLES